MSKQQNLKSKTISSMLWSATQRFGVLILSFVSNLVLAWYLSAEDFGAIGMLSIFISLSETFIDSGLGAALIQKKEPTELDYSTVFWSNLFISVILYIALFFSAPFISKFYNMEILTPVLRIKAVVLIIQGFRLIQTTRLQKQLNFKRISLIYLLASFISTTVAIIAAVKGAGVWALVIKTLVDTFIRTLIFWIVGKWKPLLKFSKESFKELFSFGGVMLSTSIIITLYSNCQALIIGKAFSAEELGYYTQAGKLESIPTNAFESVVNQVTFPIFSQLKDDIEKMKNGFKKIIVSLSYICFPMMIFFIVCATPIFNFLYPEKWNPAIPYFRYLCLVGMMVSVNTINTNLVKATGKKGLYFRLQVIKRIVGIILILLSVYFGMIGLLIARVVIEYIFFIINGIVTNKAIKYKVFEQIKDLLPNYILSFAVGFLTYFVFRNMNLPIAITRLNNFVTILIEFLFFTFIYILISGVFKFKGFNTYKEILIKKFSKKKEEKNEEA